MSVVLDIVFPGSGAVVEVLGTMLKVCLEIKEGQETCKRLHERLQDIFDELTDMAAKNQLPDTKMLNKYVALVQQAVGCLERYQAKKLVFRILKHPKLMDDIRLINENIDDMYRALSLAHVKVTMEWKQQWEADRQGQQKATITTVKDIKVVLSELQDPRSQLEAILTFKFEAEKRGQQHSDEMKQCVQSMMSTVVSASKAAVPKLPSWFLPSYEVEFEREPFARGSYGTVHRGVWGSGTSVVVKCFSTDDVLVDPNVKQQIENEMNLWHEFNHPNIIKMFGASHVSSPPFIVCEDAANGDLRAFLGRAESCKQLMWRLLYQAALGLEYIHKMNIVHGDLKLNNILVGGEGKAKLSDFGLSGVRTSNKADQAADGAGALRWRAPECLTRAPTLASDVYSFAMCMIEAVSGDSPFGSFLDDDSVRDNIKHGRIPEKPAAMSADVWDLVVAMTNVDPEKRASLSQVLEKLNMLAKEEEAMFPQALLLTQSNTSSQTSQLLQKTTNPVADLLDGIVAASGQEQEELLLELIRLCVNDEQRALLYEANGVKILSNLVGDGSTYFAKLYALQGLKWTPISDDKLSQTDFDALRACIPEAPQNELASALNMLQNGSTDEKEKAIVRCACMATRGNDNILRDVGVLKPLVAFVRTGSEKHKAWSGIVRELTTFLKSGNNVQKLWTSEALGKIVGDNETMQAEIFRQDAVRPFVALLRVGTNEQKHRATYALGNVALDQDAVPKIVKAEAIPPLAALLLQGSTEQKHQAAITLGRLAVDKVSSDLMAQKGVVSSLLLLARTGTIQQQQEAKVMLERLVRYTLGDCTETPAVDVLVAFMLVGTDPQKDAAVCEIKKLSCDAQSCEEIAREGGVSVLIGLLESGTDQQKEEVAGVFGSPAWSDEVRAQFAHEGGVGLLVRLLQDATEEQKENAVCALGNIAWDDATRADVVEKGGIAALVALVLAGTDTQIEKALGAMTTLALNDRVCAEMLQLDGVVPAINWLSVGTEKQKENAAGAIAILARNENLARKIHSMGGAVPLIQLLNGGNDQQQLNAATAIQYLAANVMAVREDIAHRPSRQTIDSRFD